MGRMKATAMPMAKARSIHSRCCAIWRRRMAAKPLTRQKRNSAPKDMVAVVSVRPPIDILALISKAETPITRPTATSARPASDVDGPCEAT